MHCAACSSRIERVVGNLEGVTDCSVNLATEKAKITYDPLTITITAIAEAIAGLGFSAEVVTAETDETGQCAGCGCSIAVDEKQAPAGICPGPADHVSVDGGYGWHYPAWHRCTLTIHLSPMQSSSFSCFCRFCTSAEIFIWMAFRHFSGGDPIWIP